MSRAFAALVTIGRDARPQGRRGEVVVTPFSDRPDRFPTLERAFAPGPGGSSRELRVTSSWPHKGRWVLKLEGIDSIDEAEGLRGADLRIGEEELAVLPEGSYYDHQLRGLEVVHAESGETLGAVRGLIETGAVPVVQVDGEREEILIPLARAFVREVDLRAGRMRVSPPETEDAEA
jgi:16S rRNA processing protein RimM